MKKVLLLTGVLAGGFASAQSITVNDTLYAGLSTTYIVMDSSAASLSGTTGTGVTWNYGSLLAVAPAASNPDVIIDASASSYAASYPLSDYNDDLSTGASVFFSNTPDSVIIHGFVFTVDTYEVIMKHNVNELKGLDLPMTVGDTYVDYTEGEVEVGGFATGTTIGSGEVTCEGFGTLIVGGNTHNNILRIKLVETIGTSIEVFPFPPTTGTVTRTVYSYYDLANDKQAIFVHATIDVATDLVTDNYTAVYYSGGPVDYMGVDEVENSVSVYPNPGTDFVTLNLTQPADVLNIFNTAGQIVYSVSNPQPNQVLDLSTLTAGVYIMQISTEGVISEQKLIME